MSGRDHHFPCPCGAELADECMACALINPLGSMSLSPAIGSRPPATETTEQGDE